MRRFALILAAIAIVVLVEVAWLAPATLVATRVEEASAGALRLTDTEGTIWHARGMLVGGSARLPLAWDLEFWPLLKGDWRLRIAPFAGTPTGPPRAMVLVRSGSVEARDVDILLPAAMLAAAVKLPRDWKVGGDVAATSASFDWSPPTSRGEFGIVWRQASVTLAPDGVPIDLGNVAIAAKAAGAAIRGPIANDGGALSVRGDWEFRAGIGTTVTLALALRDGADPRLPETLAALGPKSEAGWRIEWRIPAR
jgi:hypothetical protein